MVALDDEPVSVLDLMGRSGGDEGNVLASSSDMVLRLAESDADFNG